MNLHEEEDGCRCECLSREQDGDLKTCVADFIYLFLFSIFFARSWLLFAVIYDTSACKRLHPKTCGCCIFVVPLQMHVQRREWVASNVHTLHHASLPCLWCQSGNVSLFSASVKKKNKTKKKKRKKSRLSHMHMIITSSVFCVRPS